MGYCTEALKRIVKFSFFTLNLNRLEGQCMTRNEGSARVMSKSGLLFEGRFKDYLLIREKYETIDVYALVKSDWTLAEERKSELNKKRKEVSEANEEKDITTEKEKKRLKLTLEKHEKKAQEIFDKAAKKQVELELKRKREKEEEEMRNRFKKRIIMGGRRGRSRFF